MASAQPLETPSSPRASAVVPVQRPDSRRALIMSLVTFVAALLLIEIGFRASTMGRRLATDNLYTVKADAYARSPGYDIVIAGDSRVMHGVDPRVVSRVLHESLGHDVSIWNAGLSGAPPMAELAWVERFRSHPHPPRIVVLSVSPNAFGTLLPDPPSRESLTAMYRLQDIPVALRAGASAEDLATIASVNLFSVMRYRTRLLDILLHGQGLRESSNSGILGYGPLGGVAPEVQDARARHRLIGYANEMNRTSARFGNEQIGYFRLCLQRLREAGIMTIVMNSPSATQLDAAYGPDSFYAEHMAFVRAETQRAGARWLDAQHSPALTDALFVDGDHLSVEGAARFSEWLARGTLVDAWRSVSH